MLRQGELGFECKVFGEDTVDLDLLTYYSKNVACGPAALFVSRPQEPPEFNRNIIKQYNTKQQTMDSYESMPYEPSEASKSKTL